MSALPLLEGHLAVAAAGVLKPDPGAEAAEESAAGGGNMILTRGRLPKHGLAPAVKWIVVQSSLQASERYSMPRCQVLLEVVDIR